MPSRLRKCDGRVLYVILSVTRAVSTINAYDFSDVREKVVPGGGVVFPRVGTYVQQLTYQRSRQFTDVSELQRQQAHSVRQFVRQYGWA